MAAGPRSRHPPARPPHGCGRDEADDQALTPFAADRCRLTVGGLSEVLAQVGVARAIRFLHWLDEAGVPDSHLIVAGLIEGDRPEARALRATITSFTQREVLTRLLVADRLQALQEATEKALKGGA